MVLCVALGGLRREAVGSRQGSLEILWVSSSFLLTFPVIGSKDSASTS